MKTRDVLLTAASKIASKEGLHRVTRERVAEKAGLSVGAVSYHFGVMDDLKKQVFDQAVTEQDLDVLASFIAVPSFRKKMPKPLRDRVVAHLAGG